MEYMRWLRIGAVVLSIAVLILVFAAAGRIDHKGSNDAPVSSTQQDNKPDEVTKPDAEKPEEQPVPSVQTTKPAQKELTTTQDPKDKESAKPTDGVSNQGTNVGGNQQSQGNTGSTKPNGQTGGAATQTPSVQTPPAQTPPVQTPPAQTPPVQEPPAVVPPVEEPPVEEPPVEEPPVVTPPAEDTPKPDNPSGGDQEEIIEGEIGIEDSIFD